MEKKKIIKIVGVYSPLIAKLAENNGIKYIWISGYGISSDSFAYPDLDLMSYTEKLDIQKRILKATNLKVIVDIDNGIENIFSFEKYIKELDLYNPFGICMEDEKHPKVSALYKSNNELMGINEYLKYIDIIKNNSNAKIFARTNAIVRNKDKKYILDKIAQIIQKGNINNIVLHGKDFEIFELIIKTFKQEANFFLVTSLLDDTDMSVFEKIGFSGLIIGHNILFETIKFQNNYLENLFNLNFIPQANKSGKKIIENLILKDSK